MTTTVQVSILARLITGAPMANGRAEFELTGADVDGAIIVPQSTTVQLDSSGNGTATLQSNTAGKEGTQTRVTLFDAAGQLQFSGLASIPATNCNLHDNLNLLTPSVDDAQAAVIQARGYRDQAQAVLSDAGFVAVHNDLPNIDAVANDLPNINAIVADKANLDAVAGDLPNINTVAGDKANLDAVAGSIGNVNTVATNLPAINANVANMAAIQSAAGNAQTATNEAGIATQQAQTATNQAGLAAASAAAASSVAQQDLSGVTAAALHRSPNAVAAFTIYDTRYDDGGGDWVDKVSNLSYLFETLQGSWLGWCTDETAARAVSGATTGSFFGKIGDGNFYSLNAGAGTTQVYRGNQAKPPRIWGIVMEAQRWVIYALDLPGRPMWMVFNATNMTQNGQFIGVAAVNGIVYVIGNGNTLSFGAIDFLKDDIRAGSVGYVATPALKYRQIKDRLLNTGGAYGNPSLVFQGRDGYSALGNGSPLTGIGACVTPDAPRDPVTGMRVPMVSLSTGGGGWIIQPNGTVISCTGIGNVSNTYITPEIVLFGNAGSGTLYFAERPATLSTSFTCNSIIGSNQWSSLASNQFIGKGRHTFARRSGAELGLMRLNPANPIASLFAEITPSSNTGWMAGDVRRAYLCDTAVGSISNPSTISDRSYKGASLTVFGTLTRSQVNTGSQLTAIAGFGPGNYLQEATQSADLDFGTGGWELRPWVSVPAGTASSPTPAAGSVSANGGTAPYLPTANFGVAQNIPVNAQTQWTLGTGWTASNATTFVSSGAQTANSDANWNNGQPAQGAGVIRRWTLNVTALAGGSLTVYSNFSTPVTIGATGTYTLLGGGGGSAIIRAPAGVSCTVSLQVDEMEVAPIMNRAYSSGAKWELGVNILGYLVGTAYDGTTARVVTLASSLCGNGFMLPRLAYDASGTLSLKINSVTLASTTGAPLLTLNNASAVLSVGTNYTQTSFFPGSIALARAGATVATDDQSAFAYQQEAEMFVAGAQVCLPDAGNLVDLAYDRMKDLWKVISAANESSYVGLVRTSTAPVSAGSFIKAAHESGIKLLARSTTSPGVDVTIPPWALREELYRRAEDAARSGRLEEPFDWTGQFTATTATNSTALTIVSGLVYQAGTTIVGASISGTGIPAGTTIVGVSGTTIYLSAPATANGSGVAISILDYILPPNLEIKKAFAAGSRKREGASFDYTRSYDGFRERVRFAAAPGNVNVTVEARRMAA